MSLFGLSSQGKQYRGLMDQIPQSWWDQAQKMWGLGNQSQTWMNEAMENYRPYLQNLLFYGVGGQNGPQGILDTGNQLLPGIDANYGGAKARTGNLQSLYDRMFGPGGQASAGGVYDRTNDILNDMGSAINRTHGQLGGMTSDYFKHARNRADSFHGDILSNLGGTYDTAGAGADTAYSDVLGDINKTYDKLAPPKDLGDYVASRTSRSFNPAYASQAQRLARAGASEAERNAAMRRLDTERARAINDDYSQEARYQDKRGIDLGLGRLDSTSRAKLGLEGIKRGLALDRFGNYAGEQRRMSDFETGMDMNQLGQERGNLLYTQDSLYDRYYNPQMQNVQNRRNNSILDFNMQGGLYDREGQDWANYFQQMMARNNAGMGYNQADINTRMGAGNQLTNTIGNLMNNYWNRGDQLSQGAYGGFGNMYQREAANSGWLGKLLGGVGGSLLGAFAGPVGGMIGSKVGGMLTGEGGQQSPGGTAVWGGGGYTNPFASRWGGGYTNPFGEQ